SDTSIFLQQSALNGLWVVIQKSSYFIVLTGCLLSFRLLERRLLRSDMLMFMMMVFSIPAFQYLLVLQQSSFVWFRYFSYILPITVAWIPYEISKAKHKRVYAIGCLAAMILSG